MIWLRLLALLRAIRNLLKPPLTPAERRKADDDFQQHRGGGTR